MKISFTLFFCFLGFFGVSQMDSFRIISPNGINIRSKPTVNSEVVGKLGYWEQVFVTDTTDVPDTLFKKGSGNRWVRVKFNDTSGYALNTFLMHTNSLEPFHGITNFEAKNGLNEDYILLIPGQYCHANLRYFSKMYWYAILAGEGSRSVIIETAPQVYAFHGMSMWTHEIYSEKGDNVLFMIGSKQELNVGTKKAEGVHTSKTDIGEFSEFSIVRTNHRDSVMIRTGNGNQMLNDIGVEERHLEGGASVYWKGDINSDGTPDYVIWYGEKWSEIVLYLSTIVNGKVKYKALAIFYSGYCC